MPLDAVDAAFPIIERGFPDAAAPRDHANRDHLVNAATLQRPHRLDRFQLRARLGFLRFRQSIEPRPHLGPRQRRLRGRAFGCLFDPHELHRQVRLRIARQQRVVVFRPAAAPLAIPAKLNPHRPCVALSKNLHALFRRRDTRQRKRSDLGRAEPFLHQAHSAPPVRACRAAHPRAGPTRLVVPALPPGR